MMTKTQVNKGLTRSVSWFSALFLLTGTSAWSATAVSDKWTATDASEGVIVDFNATTITATLPGGLPQIVHVTLIPGSTDEFVTFKGNYAAAGAQSIAFSLNSNKPISGGSMVRLVGANSEREWFRYNLSAGANLIDLNRVNGNWITVAQGDLNAFWNEDLANVDSVALIVRNSSPSSLTDVITVSNFTLSSDRSIGAILTLEDRLLARFGVTSLSDLSEEDLAADSDNDGMTDVNVILAENDPYGYFGENLFKANVVAVSDDSVTVEFARVTGLSYTIIRMLEVGGTPTVVDTINADVTGIRPYIDNNPPEDVKNAYYYVIQN